MAGAAKWVKDMLSKLLRTGWRIGVRLFRDETSTCRLGFPPFLRLMLIVCSAKAWRSRRVHAGRLAGATRQTMQKLG